MEPAELVELLRGGVPEASAGEWADLGSGDGNFTLALAALLGPGARIHSVDRDGAALRRQDGRVREERPEVEVITREADLRRPLGLAGLAGVLMANSLHFQRDQAAVLRLVRSYLAPGGRLLLVEYGSGRRRPWVPHPVPFDAFERLAAEAGFRRTELLATRPGRFGEGMYSAVSYAG